MAVRGCQNCGHESHCDTKLYKDFGEKKEVQKIQPLEKIVIDKSNIDVKNENEKNKNKDENDNSWDII